MDVKEKSLDKHVAKLGFGLMRLPNNNGVINIEETKEMVDAFLEARFNYFDTAFAYPGSEEAINKALVSRYARRSFYLATKCAAWKKECKSREDAINQYKESLSRTGASYFDFYLLHNLGGDRTKVFEEYDLWSYFLSEKEKGNIKHLGFSFHSNPEELDEILTKHKEVEFVQLQINYLDWLDDKIQAMENYKVARKHNKSIIVMEPIKGGLLANVPEKVKELFSSYNNDSPSLWALRFALSLDGVLTVLSGMSNIEQMKENTQLMKKFRPLNEEEKEIINEARRIIKERKVIECTGCKYCESQCPKEIKISSVFSSCNYTLRYNNKEKALERYRSANTPSPESCLECGRCEKVCPESIEIRKELKRAKELIGY